MSVAPAFRRPATAPSSWRVAATPPWLVAAGLAALWLAVAPRTPDLAAQVYRAGLFAREGFAVWDNNWFAGHHLPAYSLVFPPLAALVGTRLVGVGAAVVSTLLFGRLARAHFGERARFGTLWFAAAAMTDLLVGRITYGLGVAVGLGALTALRARRPQLAAALGVLCAATSPVAAAFLALAAVAIAIDRRSARGLVLAIGALGGVIALAVAFPEGGSQPCSLLDLAGVLASAAAILALVPTEQRALRIGAALYGLAGIATFLIATPMGSNVTRLGMEFAGPLLACAVWPASRRRLPLRLPLQPQLLVALAALGLLFWQWSSPVHEVMKGVDDPSTSAAYYAPLIGFLDRAGGPPARLEVPFTRGHWESVYLARRFPLARGWETQLDVKYDPLFYDATHRLTPRAYHVWLRRAGVRFVALPDVPLADSSQAEAALLRRGLPYLRPVWRSRHWRVFELRNPLPLVRGSARLVSLSSSSMVLDASARGAFTVRVHYSPYFRLSGGRGCVGPARGGWTRIEVTAPARVRVVADFTPLRVLEHGPRCTKPAIGA
jgi:hypothetical protein